ncbi:MAG: hypothetical protein AB7P03_18250 [Kofleriaceae bacterium]
MIARRAADGVVEFLWIRAHVASWGVSRTGIAVLRLTVLTLAAGLATTRVGLVLHELLGHGGAAVAVGGELTDVRLFWFAGGWVRYRDVMPADSLIVSLGGIAVELVLGLVLWLAIRGRGVGARIVRTVGAALVVHGCAYLAAGTWHGYGDGWMVHRELGDQRWMIAIPAGAVCGGFAFLGARWVFGSLSATVPGTRRVSIAAALGALAIAGAIQVAAAATEVLVVRRDAVYAGITRTERERAIDRELARWLAEQRRRGIDPSEAARAQTETELERRHQTFPFAWLLAMTTSLAAVMGAIRSPVPASPGEVSARSLRVAVAVAAGSLGLVIALGAALN